MQFATYYEPVLHVHQCHTNLLFMVYLQRNNHATNLSQMLLTGQFLDYTTIVISFTCHRNQQLEAFEDINQVVLDQISDNMESLVQSEKYGSINTTDTTTNGYYVIKFILEAYRLKNNTTIDGQCFAVELVFKAQYLCSMQGNTDLYWEKNPLQQTIIFSTRTIINPHINVVGITDVHDIPKSVCNRIQAKRIH